MQAKTANKIGAEAGDNLIIDLEDYLKFNTINKDKTVAIADNTSNTLCEVATGLANCYY